MESIDKFDLAILQELQADGRLTNAELAQRVGLSAAPCWRRVRALEEAGFIKGYHAEIDRAALNRGVQAMVSVQVRPLSRDVIDTFKASASKMPEVLSVFVLAGGDDFLLHVGVPDLDALHAFLLDRLSKRREVTGFRTSVIFQQVSNPVPGVLPGLAREPAAGR